MYSASSLAASCFAVVVFPVPGVPVMSMTRLFMVLVCVEESFIHSARLVPSLKCPIPEKLLKNIFFGSRSVVF